MTMSAVTQTWSRVEINVVGTRPHIERHWAMKDDVRVFQFHSGSALGDAVTNCMFYIKEILNEYSIKSDILVEHRDPRLADRLSLIGQCQPKETDLFIIHHSMGHDLMPLLAAIKCRKVLLYHNITPPHFFPNGSEFYRYAIVGLHQLYQLRDLVSGAMADSGYN